MSILDELQLDIDSDVDECQIALSPKVVLSRLKCSPKDTGKTTSDKDLSRKRYLKLPFFSCLIIIKNISFNIEISTQY